ncbi:four helix bundle protein [Fodinibius salinus]|uniref:four helix bundle protein n=1 Tax=Fodinibius salinus TaxID=860790 RepID=UPI0011E6F78C|nr:four helix bundle protein [Fodinibius salinus]
MADKAEKISALNYFIAYKEARETHYWLRLLRDSKLITSKEVKSMLDDCYELKCILGAILTTLNKE